METPKQPDTGPPTAASEPTGTSAPPSGPAEPTATSGPPSATAEPTSAPRAVPHHVLLAAVTSILLLLGLVLAYGQRNEQSPTLALVVLVAASLLALAAAAWGVAASRPPRGLRPRAGAEAAWPVFPWWWLTGATGMVDLLAGPLVSGWLGVLGILLVAAALLGLGLDLRRPETLPDRAVVRAARRLRRTSATQAAVAPVGALGVRVTAFDARGRLVDVVVRDTERAELAVAVAGLELVAPTGLQPPLRTG